MAFRVDHLNFLIDRGHANPKALDRLRQERRALQWAFCTLVSLVEDPQLQAMADRFVAERAARKLESAHALNHGQ